VITRPPGAKHKLHGWSGNDALLMGRGRDRADKTDPWCPLMISSSAWRHCCRYRCYGFTLASLPWSVGRSIWMMWRNRQTA